ncbi:hypothetical protein GCM10017044_13650 [Kordiimonas sediminis]|uniref:DoxX family protein n=1 Tax=Kordiimonas sediminis TaxID=1735581 RepID=A0A919AQX3_9PROT|nr:DoxX family protein [Kordiimonas sediminis]GHF20130.1 hypothetical protein GCM10017044_13650 [Kordiimonas sediminis]
MTAPITSTLTALADNASKFDNLTTAALRIATGLFLMPHGAQKLFGMFGGYGLEATGQFFESQLGFSNGYLAALGAGSVEFFLGLTLALGLFTRFSAAAITVMLFVASSVHFGAGFFWTEGGWEYPILWAILALSFVTKGGGDFSLDKAFGIRF